MPHRILIICIYGAMLFTSLLTTTYAATTVAGHVYLISGSFPEDRQPDGNSIVLQGSKGLIVIDTGRHVSHTQQLVELAAKLREPVAAVINTHWHLDHLGGNALLRNRYPDMQIYASGAIREAFGGFLHDYKQQLDQAIAAAKPSQDVSAWQAEIDLINAEEILAPTQIIDRSVTMKIAGRRLALHLEHGAVSAGDIWVEDPATSTVISGDLVTLPVPFFDTACATGWDAALDHIAAVPFKKLIPGHGPPLTKAQFQTYRHAFSGLLLCAATDESSASCASRWMSDVGVLVDENERKRVDLMIDYYFKASLRAGENTRAKFCRTSAGEQH